MEIVWKDRKFTCDTNFYTKRNKSKWNQCGGSGGEPIAAGDIATPLRIWVRDLFIRKLLQLGLKRKLMWKQYRVCPKSEGSCTDALAADVSLVL